MSTFNPQGGNVLPGRCIRRRRQRRWVKHSGTDWLVTLGNLQDFRTENPSSTCFALKFRYKRQTSLNEQFFLINFPVTPHIVYSIESWNAPVWVHHENNRTSLTIRESSVSFFFHRLKNCYFSPSISFEIFIKLQYFVCGYMKSRLFILGKYNIEKLPSVAEV